MLAVGDFGGHHGAEADAAGAVHDDAAAEGGFETVEHGTGASLDTAAERVGQRQIHVGGHFDGVVFVHDGIGAEGGLAEEGGKGLAVLMQTAAVMSMTVSDRVVGEGNMVAETAAGFPISVKRAADVFSGCLKTDFRAKTAVSKKIFLLPLHWPH